MFHRDETQIVSDQPETYVELTAEELGQVVGGSAIAGHGLVSFVGSDEYFQRASA